MWPPSQRQSQRHIATTLQSLPRPAASPQCSPSSAVGCRLVGLTEPARAQGLALSTHHTTWCPASSGPRVVRTPGLGGAICGHSGRRHARRLLAGCPLVRPGRVSVFVHNTYYAYMSAGIAALCRPSVQCCYRSRSHAPLHTHALPLRVHSSCSRRGARRLRLSGRRRGALRVEGAPCADGLSPMWTGVQTTRLLFTHNG